MGCIKRFYTLVQRHIIEIAVDRPDYTKKKDKKSKK
jgi:hypothetical protein